MSLFDTVKAMLAARGIMLCAPLPLSACRIQKPYLLERAGLSTGTAILFAVPYYTTQCDDPARNISNYAVSADYHGFFRALFDEVIPALERAFPANRFAGFTDHSPIAEAEAAVRAGLGFFGRNHLFLTERHSSFVFIGEIITDAVIEAAPAAPAECIGCGACLAACPVGLDVSKCLSALTQKKGVLSAEEQGALLRHGLAWGCDRCQEVCPVTRAAKKAGTLYTDITYFKDSALPRLTAEAVETMDDETFAARAYSWRGRETILRNLRLLQAAEGKEEA